MRCLLLLLVIFTASTLPLRAVAPAMSVKDLALMARTGYTEEEILADAKKRGLAAPIDETGSSLLSASGMSTSLVVLLQAPELQIRALELARSAQARQARAASEVAEENRIAALERQQARSLLSESERATVAAQAQRMANRENMMRQLEGKLVRLEGRELVNYPARHLAPVRLFAFYYADNWTPASRETTAKVIAWYRRVKPEHPEFELIFVSRDKSDAAMLEHVRKFAMPFPVVCAAARDEGSVRQFGGEPTPWISAVSRTGSGVTKNLVTKEFVAPEAVLTNLKAVLDQLRQPGALLAGE